MHYQSFNECATDAKKMASKRLDQTIMGGRLEKESERETIGDSGGPKDLTKIQLNPLSVRPVIRVIN